MDKSLEKQLLDLFDSLAALTVKNNAHLKTRKTGLGTYYEIGEGLGGGRATSEWISGGTSKGKMRKSIILDCGVYIERWFDEKGHLMRGKHHLDDDEILFDIRLKTVDDFQKFIREKDWQH